MANCQSETVNIATQVSDEATDSLGAICFDLESAIGKIETLSALLGRLADGGDSDALVFFSLTYSTEAIHDEVKGVFERLFAWRLSQPGSDAAGRAGKVVRS